MENKILKIFSDFKITVTEKAKNIRVYSKATIPKQTHQKKQKTRMAIFDFLKKKEKFIDDFFGELAYKKFKDSSENFFYGEVKFQEKLIGIDISASKDGPTNEQKAFFKKLNAEYAEIKNKIILPFLKKEFAGNIENDRIENFDSELVLDGISIGIAKNGKLQWQITYESKPMRHYVLIDFIGMEPKCINIIE